MARALTDLTGNRFGKLVVVSRADGRPAKSNPKIIMSQWLVRCDCGVEKVVTNSNLRSGHHQSCGCVRNSGGQRASYSCECGNYRRKGEPSCDACYKLDGIPGTPCKSILSELRVYGPCTASFLMDITGYEPETVYRALSDLRKKGRAISFDDEGQEAEGFAHAAGQNPYTWRLI